MGGGGGGGGGGGKGAAGIFANSNKFFVSE